LPFGKTSLHRNITAPQHHFTAQPNTPIQVQIGRTYQKLQFFAYALFGTGAFDDDAFYIYFFIYLLLGAIFALFAKKATACSRASRVIPIAKSTILHPLFFSPRAALAAPFCLFCTKRIRKTHAFLEPNYTYFALKKV
jgi:hypothetical protein